MINGIYLLLGSNLADKRVNIQRAFNLIDLKIGKIILKSSLYETEPWGIKDQNKYLNQVLKLESQCSPRNLLKKCNEIESIIGRKRSEKWGERIIDIDILYYDDQVISDNELVIPHPEIQNRRFTLELLVELAPNLIHPILQKDQKQLLLECTDPLGVKKVTD